MGIRQVAAEAKVLHSHFDQLYLDQTSDETAWTKVLAAGTAHVGPYRSGAGIRWR
jgi:hypothetical protein